MDALNSKVKKALFLWLEGFREACCLHRVVILCLRSRMLLFRIGECFLLNGLIFLGSIFILHSVITPILHWILPDQCQLESKDMSSFGMIVKIHSFLRVALLQLFYIFWFYPLYVFSMVLSGLWYNDIAKYGFIAMGKPKPSITDQSNQEELVNMQNPSHVDKPAGLGGIIIGIGEQVYSVLLLSFFFLEVYAAGFVPYIGKILNFILLSWIYAYYCFEYKWNLSGLPLDKRLDFFESNWAFFAGFGSPCVLAIFFFTPLVSYGVMAVLFPLFVLSATCSEAEQVINSQRRVWKGPGLGRLPVFYAADTLSMWILSLFSNRSQGRLRDEKLL